MRHLKDIHLIVSTIASREEAEFIFVGILKNGVVFDFGRIRLFSLKLSVVKPFFRLNHGAKIENERLSDSFFDKRVVIDVKFMRVSVACNIIVLEDNSSHSFTFTPKSFTFDDFVLKPPEKSFSQTELIGFVFHEDAKLIDIYRFLMEEKYLN